MRSSSINIRAKQGFTLLELLIVTTIVGVLAGLLLAAIGGVRNKVRKVHCLHNLRQLGLGLNQFVSDFHAYPLAVNFEIDEGRYLEHDRTWVAAIGREGLSNDALRSSTNNWWEKGVWHCPAGYRPESFPKNIGFFDYGYNGWGVSDFSAPGPLGLGGRVRAWPRPGEASGPPITEAEVLRPSEMIALGDGFKGGNGVIRDGYPGLWRVPQGDDYLGSTERAQARHKGKANVIFCDGHTESILLQTLFGDTSNEALRRWNRDSEGHAERLDGH